MNYEVDEFLWVMLSVRDRSRVSVRAMYATEDDLGTGRCEMLLLGVLEVSG